MSNLSIFNSNYFKIIVKPQLVTAISDSVNIPVWQIPTTLVELIADYSNNIDYPFDVNYHTYRRLKNEYIQFVETKLIENPSDDGFIEEKELKFRWKVEVISILEWKLCIVPTKYPYAGGYFYFQLKFPNDNQDAKRCYPLEYVKIKVLTKIYSFLVNKEGLIALSCFREMYDITAATTIDKIVKYIHNYIFTNSPSECCCRDQEEIITLYENNQKQYFKNAEQWTKLYASK